MGEVYRARDNTLGRDVALKLLPAAVGGDAERLARFRREAQMLATLNHPHIAQIYGIDEADATRFLVLEFVDGETLDKRIARGRIGIDEAISIAEQLIAALDVAHEHGIVHRDLKPANIALTQADQVKVLDFGLAKATAAGVHPGDATDLATITSPPIVTGRRVILGTAAYMAPEQAVGDPVDKRADVWSFGVILYEMVTGTRPFRGDTVTEALSAVIKDQPDMDAVPARLRPLLASCLEKDRRQRLRDIGDARPLLLLQPAAVAPARPRASFWVPAAAGVLALSAAAFGWWSRREPAVEPRAAVLTIVSPAGKRLSAPGTMGSEPQIAPDGSGVLYQSNQRLFFRRLDSLDPELVPGSTRISNAAFWAADSKNVAIPTLEGLVRVRLPDGAPQRLTGRLAASRGGSWNERGTILLSAPPSLLIVPASGGEPNAVKVTLPKRGSILSPEFLPGGDIFLFLFVPDDTDEECGVYLATLRNLSADNPTLLLNNSTAAHYTPAVGGRLLFVHDDTLYAQHLNVASRRLEGDAVVVAHNVLSQPARDIAAASFSVSAGGVVAWRPGGAALSRVTMFDRAGSVTGTAGPPDSIASLYLSRNGSRLIAEASRSWLLEPGQPGRVSLPSGTQWFGWSADGSTVLGANDTSIVAQDVAGGPIRTVAEFAGATDIPQDVSPDGTEVLSKNVETQQLFVTSWRHGRTARTAVQVLAGLPFQPRFSPDARWITYQIIDSIFAGSDRIVRSAISRPRSCPADRSERPDAGMASGRQGDRLYRGGCGVVASSLRLRRLGAVWVAATVIRWPEFPTELERVEPTARGDS